MSPTILLVLNIVMIGCALFITWKAYQDSAMWGVFFFFTPVVYYGLTRFTGQVLAGVIVIGLQLYYVANNWKAVGTPYVVMLVAWLAATFLPALLG